MKLEKASREEMKKEALQRLEMLKVHENVTSDLENENILNKSEYSFGILYWLNNEEKTTVEEFENKYNVFVYHVIKTNATDFGFIYDLLFITDEKELHLESNNISDVKVLDKELWLEERKRLKAGIVLSHTKSQFSESGDIAIKNVNGGLVRLY